MKLDKVPPETETSPTAKLEDASLRVNVKVVVSPAIKLVALAVTEMLGGVVSAGNVTVKVTLLFASAPSSLKIPSASENLPLPTLIDAPLMPSVLAVKIAV